MSPDTSIAPKEAAATPARQRRGDEREARYRDAAAAHGAEIARFVAGHERIPALRQELLQDVHVALWKSLEGFAGACSLRTWAYRVAHNVCVSHVQRRLRHAERDAVGLEAAELVADEAASVERAERRIDLDRVMALVHRLGPIDRQVMLLWLEDLDAAAIGEVTGLSAANVATRVHRLKSLLAVQLGTRRSSP